MVKGLLFVSNLAATISGLGDWYRLYDSKGTVREEYIIGQLAKDNVQVEFNYNYNKFSFVTG